MKKKLKDKIVNNVCMNPIKLQEHNCPKCWNYLECDITFKENYKNIEKKKIKND